MKARQFTTLCSLVHVLSKSHLCAGASVPSIVQMASYRGPFSSYIRFSAPASSTLPAFGNALTTPSFASAEYCRRQTLVTNVPCYTAELISERLHQSPWPGLRGIPSYTHLGRTDKVIHAQLSTSWQLHLLSPLLTSSLLRQLKCLPKHQRVDFLLSRASSNSTASSSAPSEGRPDEQSTFQEEDDRQFWSLSEVPNVPLPALALGAAGLIPFVALAPPIDAFLPQALFYGMHVQAQAAYGAVILTFLGAPHWGLAMADYAVPSEQKLSNMTANSLRYLWSVVPSLLGWLALLLPPIPQFALLISSFGLVIGVDIAFSKMKLVPSWYLTLRVPLTTIAILSLTANLVVAVAGTFNR